MKTKLFLIYFFTILFYSRTLPLGKCRPEESDEDETDSEDYDDEDCPKIENFVGTNLFETESMCKEVCLSTENVGLLTARKEFENLLPKGLPKTLMDDELVMSLMQYFYGAKQVIIRMSTGKPKDLSEKAFYDTLGGYLQWYVIPVVKNSFYSGLVCLKIAKNVMEVYRQCKIFLNTNGNGWKTAINDFTDFEITIQPILLMEEVDDTACLHLELSDDKENDDDMLVPLPKLDREEKGMLSNIWLPFKRKKSFNLRSYHSAFIFLKYFEMVSKCYKYENVCQDNFNKKLREWIEENIEVHLEDEIFYPGLGAILRIQQTLRHKSKNVGKRVSKKELHETEDGENPSVNIALVKVAHKHQAERRKDNGEDHQKHHEPEKKDFLNELFGKFASKDVARCGDYEDEEYTDDNTEDKETKSKEKNSHREKYLMALWVSLAFLLFFCICCIPIMIIWNNRGKSSSGEESGDNNGSNNSGKSKDPKGDRPDSKDNQKKSKNEREDDRSKKKDKDKDRDRDKKKGKDDKVDKKKEDRPDKDKQKKGKENPNEKKSEKKSKKDENLNPKESKKNYDSSLSSTETDVTSSNSMHSTPPENLPDIPICRIPAPTNQAFGMRTATETQLRPPANKKFSISRRGKVPNNDPVAQRLALARGDQKDNPIIGRRSKTIEYKSTKELRENSMNVSSGWETTDWSKT